METLAIVLLTVWLLGIVVTSVSVVMALKDESTQNPDLLAMQDAVRVNPTAAALTLALVILVWPFALLQSAFKKGVK